MLFRNLKLEATLFIDRLGQIAEHMKTHRFIQIFQKRCHNKNNDIRVSFFSSC